MQKTFPLLTITVISTHRKLLRIAEKYKTVLLLFLGSEYKKHGWVMQLHYGCDRNVNSKMFKVAIVVLGSHEHNVVGYLCRKPRIVYIRHALVRDKHLRSGGQAAVDLTDKPSLFADNVVHHVDLTTAVGAEVVCFGVAVVNAPDAESENAFKILVGLVQ